MKKLLLVLVLLCVQVALVHARNVSVPSRSKDICVGESRRIMQLGQQALWWKINGRGSRLSTFNVSGRFAMLTADVDTANVVAACRTRGREMFNISWRLAYNDNNTYNMNYIIGCLVCVEKGARVALRKARKIIKGAIKVIDEGELSDYQKKKVIKEIERAKKKLKKQLSNRKLSKIKKIQIQKLIDRLNDLVIALLEGMDYDEILDMIESSLTTLINAVELTPIVPVPGPIRPIPIRPVPITPFPITPR